MTQLTNDAPFFARPVWSPDGQWLACGREGAAGIEVVRPDGTARRTLTLDQGSGYKFAWSPDSLHIAYRAFRHASNAISQVIKSVEVASGHTTDLSKPPAEAQPPIWICSGPSQRVCFVAGHKRVETAGRDATSRRDSTSARDTDLLLYSDEGQVWSCAADGVRRRLTDAGGIDPVWSPDRRRVVYSQMGVLMLMDPDGSNKRPLARGHHPSWSPDGQWLVYDVTTDDGHRILTADLWVVRVADAQSWPLTVTPDVLECDPAWAPDGQRIACRTETSGRLLLLWLE